MCTLKRAIGLVMLILISGMVCITSHTEDACAARMVNVSGDVPRDNWADATYSEIHDSQIENLTWGDISHSQERSEHETCKYVEESIDSTNTVCKNIYGNRTNDSAEEVNLKRPMAGNIRMPVTDANNNRIEDCLEGSAMRTNIDDGAEVDVIVMYRKKSSEPSYSVSYSTLNTLNTLGATVKYNYKTIDATALKMPAGNLNDLAEVPGVEMIYLDHEVHALLDTSVPVIRGDQARSTFGVSGVDVTIAVIDTGIDASHESLDDLDDDPATDDDKVIAFADFVNSQPDPYDDHGHGTHCAGIAAGTGGDSEYVGVAPMSRLVGVKVLDQYGSGSESDCIAGIEWCVLNKDVYGIDVISISWGTDMNGDGTSPTEIACDSAVDAGIVVCVTAGNSGPGSSTVGTPASAKEVIAVGAIEDSMDIAYFSSRGPTADGRTKPDVCAVGVDVTAPAANSGDGYVTHSGTSMATPHVAGVAALMIEYNPYITPSEVKDILHNTSVDKGDLGPDNTYGWGVVDSVAALGNVSVIRITLGAGGPYDPGDRVTIAGSTSNRTISVSAVVNITATSPDGSIVAFNTTTSHSEGDFSVDFVLPDDSEPGDYKVEVTASHNDETGRRIATFKVGTLIIGMDAPDMVITGDPYPLEGSVRYDDGTPVSGADLNVTIKNLNGTPVYTNHTSSNTTGHFSIQWTPEEASIYAVQITARDAATLKVGLNTTTFHAPCGIVTVAVLDSWGADYNESTIWDDLNKNWYKYGDYLIDINYTALNKEDITYGDLDKYGADVLLISDAWDDGTWTGNNWEFSDSEISTIKRYVQEGHGIVGTSGTLSTDVPNNMLLAPMFGLDPDEIGEWAYWFSPLFELLRPDHPLFTRIPDPYRSGIDMTVANLALNPDYPGTVVARSIDRTASIYGYRGDHVAAGASVYFTHIVELSDANQEDRQIVYNSFVWAKTNIERKPHEIAVYNLEAPDWIEPDNSTLISATITNNGLNDEGNIEVNLVVDGAIVESITIHNLSNGTGVPVSFEWATPSTEGVYDVAIHAVPVSGENITVNNVKNKSVRVITPAGCMKAVVLDSYGTDDGFITGFWDDLGDGWYIYGDYVLNIDYTTLNIENITYHDISDTGADVLIISCAYDWEFADSEIAAISHYVEEGHGIIATAGTFDSWVSNNIKLAPLFGMADITGDAYWTSGNFTLYYPEHPIFLGLNDPYQSESGTTNYPWGTTTGSLLAMTDDGYSSIITNDVTGTDHGYANIYLNHFPESYAGPNDTQLFYNAIVWAGIPHPKPDHDISLSGFEYPDRVCCNMPVRFNVTLKNNGLNDEADVTVNLTVDGVVLNSTGIPSIAQGTNIPLQISWTPASPGYHRIDLSVTEVPDEDITFNNRVSAGIDVPVAGFSGEYSDYGSDTNGDGLYDYLVVDVGVNVAAAGNYRIYGELYDEYGSWIDYEGGDYVYLDVGSQSIPLEFSGIKIRQNGVNGTYDLRYLYLYDDDWNRLDYIRDAHTTSYYNYTDFQRPPAEFNDIYSDYGTDTDGDGFYDYLTIEVGVDVITAGYYEVNGELYDSYGDYIGGESNYTCLTVGNQTVQLDFDGVKIRQNGVNGTYDLRYLYLHDDHWNQLEYIYDAYTTSYYNYTDFQRPPAEFSNIYSDYGADTDGDGLYDYLTIEVGVNVTTSGYYQINGDLYDSYGDYIGWGSNYTYMSAGNQTVQLDFDGIAIRQNGVNGTYDLRYLNLYDDHWNQLDCIYDAYTTSYYNYTEFQRPPAEFSNIYSDYGADTDGDGLYDNLTIEVGVNVTKAGRYKVGGELCENATHDYIISADNTTYLDIGAHNVSLKFDGIRLRQNRYNGTYDLKYLYLYNYSHSVPSPPPMPTPMSVSQLEKSEAIEVENISVLYGEQLDYRYYAYTTSYYNYTEFEESIPDAYEPDDNYSFANYISVDGNRQTHNFHIPGDHDWLKFNATSDESYTIETSDLGDESDTYLYLYATDGTTEIDRDDDGGVGLASKIVWDCSISGTYYAMVRHYGSSAFGPETKYNISVVKEASTLVKFSDVYSDYGEDTDGNGLYDNLTIEVGVNVTTAGYYQINGNLYDRYGDYIGWESNYTYLNAEDQTVQLDFDGIEIRQNEVNGTYDLRYLYLYDDDRNQLDYINNAYTTTHYNYTEFQRPPVEYAPPAIISWSNDKTNNDSLHITVNESESVRFNTTANQTITTWNWFNNGVTQPDNNDYYITSWSVNETYTVSVNATNANGTSDTKTWTIIVGSCDYDPADTNQDCVVSMMELMAHISKWKSGEVGMMELMTSIGRWKLGTGGYC